jgi:hypothetical protein
MKDLPFGLRFAGEVAKYYHPSLSMDGSVIELAGVEGLANKTG